CIHRAYRAFCRRADGDVSFVPSSPTASSIALSSVIAISSREKAAIPNLLRIPNTEATLSGGSSGVIIMTFNPPSARVEMLEISMPRINRDIFYVLFVSYEPQRYDLPMRYASFSCKIRRIFYLLTFLDYKKTKR